MNNTINRRVLIKSLLLLFSSSFSLVDSKNHKKFTIIFGSCSNQNNKMQETLSKTKNEKPTATQLFIECEINLKLA